MPDRLPLLHPSALSPQEHARFAPLLPLFDPEPEPGDDALATTWGKLCDCLKDTLDGRTMQQILALLVPLPPTFPHLHLALAMLRLASHALDNARLTRDHIFLQPERVVELKSPLPLSEWAAKSSLAPGSSTPSPRETNPFRRSVAVPPPPSPTSATATALPLSPPATVSSFTSTIKPPAPAAVALAEPPPPRRNLSLRSTASTPAENALAPPAARPPVPAPPLPLRRAQSLAHPPTHSSSTAAPQAPPPRAPKPPSRPHLDRLTGSTHIGPGASLSSGGGGGGGRRSRSNSAAFQPPQQGFVLAPAAASPHTGRSRSGSASTSAPPPLQPTSPFASFAPARIALPDPDPDPDPDPGLAPAVLPPPRRRPPLPCPSLTRASPFADPSPAPALRSAQRRAASAAPAPAGGAGEWVAKAREGAEELVKRAGSLSLSSVPGGGGVRRRGVTGGGGGGGEGAGLLRSSGEEDRGEGENVVGVGFAADDELLRDEAGEGEASGTSEEDEEPTVKERRSEVDREARRRDEQGQWARLG
ncbi:hypothetical protein JCM10449v2_003941 [Rhodotorula kratochvilovae]